MSLREVSTQPHHVERLPDGCALLLLRLGRTPDLSLSGPCTRAIYKRAPGDFMVVEVSLAPGATSRLFGEILGELVDRTVLLESVWGARTRALLHRAAEHPSQAADILLCELDAHLQGATTQPTAATLTRRALRRIELAPAEVTVSDLAHALGVTPRHLRRTFLARVGLSPKRYIRMRRLHHALHSEHASARDWARVAATFGYADQAHLSRESRALYGMPPATFAERHDHATTGSPWVAALNGNLT